MATGNVQAVNNFAFSFLCDAPDCGRSFKSKRGLGQHRVRAHPEEANRDIDVDRVKNRWSAEEEALLAQKEAEWSLEGPALNINLRLAQHFPQRTYNSIKSHRKSPVYRELVDRLRAALARRSPAGTSESITNAKSVVGPDSNRVPALPCAHPAVTTSIANRPTDQVFLGHPKSGSVVLDSIFTKSDYFDENFSKSKNMPVLDNISLESFSDLSPRAMPTLSPVSPDDFDEFLFNNTLSENFGSPDPGPSSWVTSFRETVDDLSAELSFNRTSFEESRVKVWNSGDSFSMNVPLAQDANLSTIIETSPCPDPPLPLDSVFTFLGDLFSTFPGDCPFSKELFKIWEDFRLKPNCPLKLESLFIRSSLVLDSLLPGKPNTKPLPAPNITHNILSKKQIRASNYAKFQRWYRKNPKRCVDTILSPTDNATFPDPQNMRSFWENVMSKPSGPSTSPEFPVSPDFIKIFDPITPDQVQKALPSLGAAPGPDGITSKELRGISTIFLSKFLNIFILCGKLPEKMLLSKTIFIPKSNVAKDPGDFRPISISSVFTRLFHKILAFRLSSALGLAPEQRAFISSDGINENIFLLDFLLHNAKTAGQESHFILLDVIKAFDSISHQSLIKALAARGVERSTIEYIDWIYGSSFTIFSFPGAEGSPFHPTCGVRQGDPLSPILFNLVLDFTISELKNTVIGIPMGSSKITIAAYADDLILCSSTTMGMQALLDKACGLLAKSNLRLHGGKTMALSIKADRRHRKTKVVDSVFKMYGAPVKSLGPTDSFKYLGVEFDRSGVKFTNPVGLLRDYINKLQKAPLKPHQKLFTFRNFIVPKLFHSTILGNCHIGILKQLDVISRDFIRKILNLPHDTPSPYFHTSICSGGLGIISFRVKIPRLRAIRLNKIFGILSLDAVEDAPGRHLSHLVKTAWKRDVGQPHAAYWENLLYQTIDGAPLGESKKTGRQHEWVGAKTPVFAGKEFIRLSKLRINALPTKSRLNRGRPGDRMCRAGCPRIETQNHIQQCCPRTHGKRIHRHDGLLNYICRGLDNKKIQYIREPIYLTDQGKRKPDLVIVNDNEILLVDAQIVGDNVDLKRAHNRKIRYYGDNSHLMLQLSAKYGVEEVTTTSLTVNWRGVWSFDSAKSLLDHKVINKRDLGILSARSLTGSLSSYDLYMKSTSRVNIK